MDVSAMSQSLARVVIRITFSTKRSTPWLRDRAVRNALYEYMGGILKALDSKAIRINGVEDHVHIVCLLSRNHALKKIIEKVKTASSKWIKTKGPRYRTFYWQPGYAAHSVSPSQLEAVDQYVANQEAHHTRMTFQEELRIICRKNGIELDERFAWD